MKLNKNAESCDLCKKSFISFSGIPGNDNFSETFIYYARGTIDPDGGSSIKTIQVGICPDCFVDKLVPFLVENGASITEKQEES